MLVIAAVAQFGVLWAGNTHNEALFLFFAFISGFGGGAFYPMFAALVPDYFGENNNATNYGMVYSAKLVGGLFGGGLGAVVVGAWGYTGAYILAGIMGLVSAVMALGLRQPGRPKAKKIEPNPYPISREIMCRGNAQHAGITRSRQSCDRAKRGNQKHSTSVIPPT